MKISWLAAASVVSAVAAIAALVISLVELVRSNSASKDAHVARENATSAQWKMGEHLHVIAEAQAETARTAAGSGARHDLAGRLSTRLDHARRGELLVIANVGTGAVTIEDVLVDQPDVLLSNGVAGVVGEELEPGEDGRSWSRCRWERDFRWQ